MRRAPRPTSQGTRPPQTARVLCFATQGSGSGDEERIRTLLAAHDPEVFPFDRRKKVRSALSLLRRLARRNTDLVVMEGTGVAGGLAVLAARKLLGCRYMFSSGDAVAPFLAARARRYRVPASWYEGLLHRRCVGFIGWSPYLVGRALTLGAPRAMTAAHFARPLPPPRIDIRTDLGIPSSSIVFGIIGSLTWNSRYSYCYGLELIEAIKRVERQDIVVVIVGGGTGYERLRARAQSLDDGRVHLVGPIAPDEVPSYLAAFDIASLPQSVDQVGSFRYTTKLPEYMSAALPVVTGQIPAAYDVLSDWCWILPGPLPWGEEYVAAMAELMEIVSRDAIAARRSRIPHSTVMFDRTSQQQRVGRFVADALATTS